MQTALFFLASLWFWSTNKILNQNFPMPISLRPTEKDLKRTGWHDDDDDGFLRFMFLWKFNFEVKRWFGATDSVCDSDGVVIFCLFLQR